MYDEKETPGEWQVDPKTGERFRMVGKVKEYEMMIHTSGGVVPQSQLEDFHKRQRDAEERRKAEQAEDLKNRQEPKSCPFSSGMNNVCKRDGCKIFVDGKCSIATIADAACVEITDNLSEKAKCPFSIYGHCESCALYNHGCAIARIATAHIKNNEIEV